MRSTSPSNNQTDLLSYSFGESMPLADLAPFARDMLFYQKRKKEKCRLVSPPKFDPCQALVRIERTAPDAALIQKIYFF